MSQQHEPVAERYFYSVASVLLLVLALVGFQHFYFQGMAYPGRPLTPPIRALIITHAVVMLVWMLLAILQPVLVASGKRRVHMTLGKVGVLLAVILVALGVQLGVASARVAPPDLLHGPLTPKQFMAVPVLAMLLFAIFVAAGVAWRKRPDIHRPMMFFASMDLVAAAIARIDFFTQLFAGTVWQRLLGDLVFTPVIAGLFLVAKCVVSRKFDRWFAAGFVVLTLWCLLTVQGAATPAWDAIATFLLR